VVSINATFPVSAAEPPHLSFFSLIHELG
jgi:hypothetical protein